MMKIKLHHKFNGKERKNPIDIAKIESYAYLISNNNPNVRYYDCAKNTTLYVEYNSRLHQYVNRDNLSRV